MRIKNKDKYTKSKILIFPTFNNSFPTVIIQMSLHFLITYLLSRRLNFSFRLLDDRPNLISYKSERRDKFFGEKKSTAKYIYFQSFRTIPLPFDKKTSRASNFSPLSNFMLEDTREEFFPWKKKNFALAVLQHPPSKLPPSRFHKSRFILLSGESLFISNNDEKSRNLSMNRKVIPKGNEAASRYTATLQSFGAL